MTIGSSKMKTKFVIVIPPSAFRLPPFFNPQLFLNLLHRVSFVDSDSFDLLEG